MLKGFFFSFLSFLIFGLLATGLFAQQINSYRPFPASPLAFSVKSDTVPKSDTITRLLYTTYYASKFEGRRTSSGQVYRASKFTAAHRTLPFGTIVHIRNIRSGKVVQVRINDRGPFSKKFELDVSQAAAKALGIYRLGYAKVEVKYELK